MWSRLPAPRRRDSGQALVEYALLLMFVAGGLLLTLVLLGDQLRGEYGRMGDRLAPAAGVPAVAPAPGTSPVAHPAVSDEACAGHPELAGCESKHPR
ncbi:MAG TPA: hypothetical protein VFW66_06255 [Gemmatimonadales bacterium]|nr:hypothetical protein [Gemmatimonadales bacterium]